MRIDTISTNLVCANGGTVDKFEGDAILAFFGAPEQHDDDPELAVRTALKMRDQLGELEHEWRRRADAALQIGIAINSGQVVVGNIGSLRRVDYTIIGDPANMAS